MRSGVAQHRPERSRSAEFRYDSGTRSIKTGQYWLCLAPFGPSDPGQKTGPRAKTSAKGTLFCYAFRLRCDISPGSLQSSVPLSAALVYLEHRVAVVRYSRHGLQHIPVLYNLAVGIKAKDIDACGFPTGEVQIARMRKR
jgi:hypothetical protein